MIVTNYTIQSGFINNTKYFNNKKISFCGKIYTDKADFALSKALEKISSDTINQYKSLTAEELNLLRNSCTKLLKTNMFDELVHDIASDDLKKYLDKKYGENNYLILTIGRSLSSIGKVIGYKIGEENVKNLPLSQAKNYLRKRFIASELSNGGIDTLNKYLEKIGLTEKTDKKIIVTDFCISGDSLKGATYLLKHYTKLNPDNVKSINFIKCIRDLADRQLIYNRLFFGAYKDYSYVNQANNLNDIPKAITDTTKKTLEVKLFRFKMLDNFMLKFNKSQK